MVESSCDGILEEAKTEDVAFLVVGDPFGYISNPFVDSSATTHADIVLRAKQLGVTVKVIHNASIMNAIGCCGLQLYNFGQTVSIVFFEENWQPDSFYDKINENKKIGLHTLCLLGKAEGKHLSVDIKVKEQTTENLLK